MPDPVIEFDHVSKKFARGEQHNTLRDFIPAMARKLLGRKSADQAAGAKAMGEGRMRRGGGVWGGRIENGELRVESGDVLGKLRGNWSVDGLI